VSDSGAYKRAGVDTQSGQRAVAGLVAALSAIDPGHESRSLLGLGHYANVVRIDDRIGIALSTDGVGSKIMVAQALERFDTIGIDCVAMNANDVICVGARPLALLDYIAVEQPDEEMLSQLGAGLKTGAEQARLEIPGGEVAQLPELIRGHPTPRGFDLVGTGVGVVELDKLVTGTRIEAGDVIIGLPSNGIHSNGLTLARKALPDLAEKPDGLSTTVGEALLEPTAIYVRAISELLEAGLARGLAHITSGGLLNLLRLNEAVGYRIDAPLPPQPIFDLIAERSGATNAELFQVFNMGCGFCAIVAPRDAQSALSVLRNHYSCTQVIGEVTTHTGTVELVPQGLIGDKHGFGNPH
jgi:phosphoribosylformylglycinamidine cyclo-ligase